ncbi:MAG: hypothetical protein ABI599_05255 [Flavobacteriales bacterium]
MRYQQCLTLAAFGALFCTSCKKDKGSDPPQITITAPFDGQSQTVPSTLTIVATISDDKGPIDGSAVLVNSNGVPVGPTLFFGDDGTSRSVNLAYPVTSELILSGVHTLRLSATDGENTTNAFRSINVTGLPLRFRGLLAVGADGTVNKLDSVLNVSTLGSFGQDLSDAAISSRQQLVYLAGAQTGPLSGVDVNTGNVRWQVANNNTMGSPYFTFCSVNDDLDRLLIGRNNGSFSTLNSALGSNLTTFSCQPSHQAVSGLLVDSYAICEERHNNLPSAQLSVHTLWADDLQAIALLDKSLVGMFQRDDDHLLLFGNRNGEGVVEDRNILQGGGFEPRTFSQGEIIDAAQVDDNTYLIALPDGIVRYTYNPDQVFLVSNLVPEHLAYDGVTGTLFAAAGNTIHVLDASTGFEAATISLPSSPIKILVLLNR